MSDIIRKILLLSANPSQTTRLELDDEIREIKVVLERAEERDKLVLCIAVAVRDEDFDREILVNKPTIVHFSGHGLGTINTESLSRKLIPDSVKMRDISGLIIEDSQGQIKIIDANRLADLFKLFARHVECVILNACYSDIQAQAISKYIPYVVGMHSSVGDKAAIKFSSKFYEAIGAGYGYDFAYYYAVNSIKFTGIPEKSCSAILKQKPNKRYTISASVEGIEIAKRALYKSPFKTIHKFAKSHFMSLNTVEKFYKCEPVRIDSFQKICEGLCLNWIEIAEGQKQDTFGFILPTSKQRESTSQLNDNPDSLYIQVITPLDTALVILESNDNKPINLKNIQLDIQVKSGGTNVITKFSKGSIRLFL